MTHPQYGRQPQSCHSPTSHNARHRQYPYIQVDRPNRQPGALGRLGMTVQRQGLRRTEKAGSRALVGWKDGIRYCALKLLEIASLLTFIPSRITFDSVSITPISPIMLTKVPKGFLLKLGHYWNFIINFLLKRYCGFDDFIKKLGYLLSAHSNSTI